jgi:hypothetical protein
MPHLQLRLYAFIYLQSLYYEQDNYIITRIYNCCTLHIQMVDVMLPLSSSKKAAKSENGKQ